jgi:hypothetical protein
MAGSCEQNMGSVRIWKCLSQQRDCLHRPGVLRKITKITRKELWCGNAEGLLTLLSGMTCVAWEARDSVGPEADVTCSILQRRSAFGYICCSCTCIASCIASKWLSSKHLQRGTRPSRQSPEHTKVLICSQRVPSIARGTFPHHSMLKQGRGFSSAVFLTVLLGLRSPILSRRTDKMQSWPCANHYGIGLSPRPLTSEGKARRIQNRELVGTQGCCGQWRRE